jgi:hypothetical protein
MGDEPGTYGSFGAYYSQATFFAFDPFRNGMLQILGNPSTPPDPDIAGQLRYFVDETPVREPEVARINFDYLNNNTAQFLRGKLTRNDNGECILDIFNVQDDYNGIEDQNWNCPAWKIAPVGQGLEGCEPTELYAVY